ncbi:MAG: CoA transferase [Dehalococcoidia bacterium]|nr:CoA transferase [Dehalococcoidia bacterium]
MTQLLEDITVLDFTQGMAGSVATMVMSDFGARVIKIEPPGGDPYRAMPSAPVWHRGKKSVILDLGHEKDRRHAQKLAGSADIVVESFIPDDAKANGVDYDTLSALNPRLIYTSITAFGDKGPYARYRPYESLVSAKSGRYMAFAGQNDREGPNYGAVQVASHAAAMAAVRGTVAALMLRDRTGRGQRVETNLLRAITYYDLLQFAVWQMMINRPDVIDFDPTVVASRPTPIQYLPVRTKDGRWMQLANLMERLFIAEVKAIGLGHLLEEPRYANAPHLDDDPREEMREFILERMQEQTMDEWMEFFVNIAGDVAAEPFMTSVEALDHSQVIYNGLVQQVEDPVLGDTRQIGPLFRMDASPPRIQGPAPQPGQHTEEVLSDFSLSPLMGEDQSEDEDFPAHPLEGYTILDLSTVIAGPVTGSLLAELGARVIRIETLAGDWMRNTFNGLATNRTMAGTQGLSIDLKSAEGREVLNRLLPKVDVVLHNMRPGAPYRVGIGIEQVRELNPDAVYVYLGGYGSSGPHSHRPSMHPIGGALGGGVMAQIGSAGIPDPDSPLSMDEIRAVSRRLGRANEVNPDPNTAMVTATAITMSLYGRQRYGKPQYAETTMIGSNAYVNADHFFDYEGRAPRQTQDVNGYGLNALHRLYESSDGWVFLDCPFEDEWQRMCETLGRSDLLADSRFADADARNANDDELISELAAEFTRKPALEWERTMTSADVGCVQTEDRGMYHFFSEDPHVEENGLRVDVEHPRFGPLWRYAPILDFSHTSCVAGAGILRGQHTIPILKELGYSGAEIHEMRAKKALDWEEV